MVHIFKPLKVTPVTLKTDLKQTTVVLEDSRRWTVKTGGGERIPQPEEVGQTQQEVKTYERKEEVKESTVKEEITLKKEISQQWVSAEERVSTWTRGGQQVEDTEPLEEREPADTVDETELEEAQPDDDEEDFPGDRAVDRREGLSFRSLSPPLKEADPPLNRDVTPPPEMICPTKKEVPPPATGFTTQKELLAIKKTSQEKNITLTHAEQRDVTKSFVSVLYDKEETVSLIEDLVKDQIVSTYKETSAQETRVIKEVTVVKQAASVKEEVRSVRSIPRSPEQDVPQIPPQTTLPPPLMEVLPKTEGMTPNKLESKIVKSAKPDVEMYVEDVPLKKPSLVLEEVSSEKQVVPESRSIPASREVSPPVPAQTPSPEEQVCSQEDISPPNKPVLPPKKASAALHKVAVAPEEDFPHKAVTPPKKPITKATFAPTKRAQVPPEEKVPTPEEETLPSKKLVSLTQTVITQEVDSPEETLPSKKLTQKVFTHEVDSPEEGRSSAITPPPTRVDGKKGKKGTQESPQETLQKGILS